MTNMPDHNLMVKGVVAAMLGLINAWLLPPQTANAQDTAAAGANAIEEQPKRTLKAGMAKTVITPPVGTQLSGYSGRTDPSTEVLDDLNSKALVVDDGKQRIALVVCDIIGFRIDMVNEIRSIIQQQTGIKPDNVMITCTHTHSGPNLRAADAAYVESLKLHVARSVAAAANSMREVRIGAARGECRVGANRRHPNSPTGPYNLYKYPAGIMDPTVMVLRVEDVSGNVIGLITNHAGHPVAWGHRELGISRDYPGFALDVVEKVWGDDVVTIFLQGCCGNLNLNWIWDRPEQSPMPRRSMPIEREPRLREVRRLGRILGGETLKAAETITDFTSDAVVKAARRDVEVPIRKDLSEKMQERVAKAKEEQKPMEPGKRGSVYDAVAAGKETLRTEVQVLRVGEYFIVGLPSEVFVEYQIEIRQRSGADFTFVSELANDSISYICTPKAFEEGGYEARSSSLAPEAGKTLVDAALKLVDELK
ncbi:MAG: neutral/alkaline non-lysosomal ceramidase N-terminal domain-containing protein [Pirellulaceae bacterium]|nr:neutral/alkaline non-lysosomal ceramidase N-terminal domain-containing protein [Pirellulaceae bacterium]